MTNNQCRIGNKTKAARRIAGMLMSGVLAGTMAAGGAGAVTAAAAGWSENADYIFEYLTQELGYTEAAACGIMANIRCESTFNPHAWNAGGGSYGLCQWTGGRYGRLRSWCRSNGFDYTTIDGQLAYLEYELENFYPGVENHLRSVENTSDGAYDAGQYYCYHFEAPASRGSVSVYRGGLASGTFWDSYRPAEWYQVDGVWHYILRDGSYQTDWLTIEDDTFYFDRDGNRISGWRTIDGDRYFFDEDGSMVKGWKKIDGRSFYFGSDGSLVTGVLHSGEDWYLLDEQGNIQASAAMEEFAPAWTAAAAERETVLASAGSGNADEQTGQASDLEAATNETDETGISGATFLAGAAPASTDRGSEASAALAAGSGPSIGLAEETETEAVSSVDLLREAAALAEAGSSADAEETASTENLTAMSDPEEVTSAVPAGSGAVEEEEEYQASADAMQAAALALAENDAAEEETETGGLAIPSSAMGLAGPLPELSNETLARDEISVLSGSTDTDRAEEPDQAALTTEPDEDGAEEASTESLMPIPAQTASEPARTASEPAQTASEGPAADESDTDTSEESDEEAAEAGTEEGAGAAEEAEEGEEEKQETAETDRSGAEADSADDENQDAGSGKTSEAAEAEKETDPAGEDTEADTEDSDTKDSDAEDSDQKQSDTEESDSEDSAMNDSDREVSDPEEDSEESVDEEESAAESEEAAEDEKISLSEIEARRLEEGGEDAEPAEKERVVISVDQKNFPDFSREDLEDSENLLEILREDQLIKVVTGSGLDITPEVTAEIEQSEEEDGRYMVTFRAEFKGSSTEKNIVVSVSDKSE